MRHHNDVPQLSHGRRSGIAHPAPKPGQRGEPRALSVDAPVTRAVLNRFGPFHGGSPHRRSQAVRREEDARPRPYGLRSRPAWGVEEAGSPMTVVGDVLAARLPPRCRSTIT